MRTTKINHIISVCFVVLLVSGLTISQLAWSFERLFTTPEQRDQLDQTRYNTAKKTTQLNTIKATKKITLNGLVHRSNGEHTAWINGIEFDRWSPSYGVFKIDHDKISQQEVPLTISPANKNIRLQPGQTANITDGQISDLLPIPDYSE